MTPPSISPTLLRFFRRIVRRYFRRQFHGVRITGQENAQSIPGPLIICGNHSSWWDPMVAFLLAEQLFPSRLHYAPMDTSALRRYRILERLGIFPVDTNSPRGAVQFLRTGEAILASRGVLWITPQGRFADVRERPLTFKPGLATLATRAAARLGSCTILPLAIEYPFWDERLPECLLRIGSPIAVSATLSADLLDTTLRRTLESEMDTLATLAQGRDPRRFQSLLEGSAGAGGFYALGKRIKAAILRRPYIPEHSPQAPAAPGHAFDQASKPVSPEVP